MKDCFRIRVPKADDGQRASRFLKTKLPNIKNGELNKLLRTREIRLESGTTKLSGASKLSSDDCLLVPRKFEAHQGKIAEQGILPSVDVVLWEDEHYIAVEKHAGRPFHQGSSKRSFMEDFPSFFSINRLDQGCSGVVVLGKTRASAEQLQKRWKSGLEMENFPFCYSSVLPSSEVVRCMLLCSSFKR